MSDKSMQGDLFHQATLLHSFIPQLKGQFKQPGGVVAEHVRMNRQRCVAKRNKRIGPPLSKPSIDERFRLFHNENPYIYHRLVKMSRELYRKGHKRYSIQGLIEVIRFEQAMVTTGDGDGFKINNDFGSRYARLIMQDCPDLDGFFETRELRAL